MWKYSGCIDNGVVDYYESLEMWLKAREVRISLNKLNSLSNSNHGITRITTTIGIMNLK